VPDGAIHRFHVPDDKPGTLNGWYVLYLDGIASGAFGSWKTNSSNTWSSRAPIDYREAEHVRQRMELARQQREAEQRKRQLDTAALAQRWWHGAPRADPDHTYLIAKGIRAHSLRQRGGELLVPLYSGGVLVNLQRICPNGRKRFLTGGLIKAAYSPIGRLTLSSPLCICEGWATGATLHLKGGYAVACAMNAGNLKPVALALKAEYQTIEIIIAGDDDRHTTGNPGRTAANAAAIAVGGLVAFPDWPNNAPHSLTDFNDLHQWEADHANE
jgi:putative DNA primase/helicase